MVEVASKDRVGGDGGCYSVGQNIPLSHRVALGCGGRWVCITVLWGCSSQLVGGTVV